jgi:hypothetical protein
VLGERWQGHVEWLCELADRGGTVAQTFENGSPGWVGQGIENTVEERGQATMASIETAKKLPAPFSCLCSYPSPACPPIRSPDWPAFISCAAKAALYDRPRPIKMPHEMTQTVLEKGVMVASFFKDIHTYMISTLHQEGFLV